MPKLLLPCIFILTSCLGSKSIPFYTEEEAHQQAIIEHQAEMDEWFSDPERSPLTAEDRETFDHLEFFSIDKKYQVNARLELTPGEAPFEMPTTTDRLPVYQKYGEIYFEIDGAEHKLSVYKNLGLKDRAYKNYLFLPFRDETTGVESYGGGRYIDLEIPKKGNMVAVDFNRSYNPYCAYSDRYSCPIPPIENTLDIAIYAGVKAYDKH